MSPIRLITLTLALVLSAPSGAPGAPACDSGIWGAGSSVPQSVAFDRSGPGPGLPHSRPRQSADDNSPDPAIIADADHPWPSQDVTVRERPARSRLVPVLLFLIPLKTGPPLA